MKDLAPRRAAGLSGGQGKMVALGRALMVGTRAVLLDEPFQGLAPALAMRYAEALKRLHQALPDVAILITESNPELLRPLVEPTFVIERGEIVHGVSDRQDDPATAAPHMRGRPGGTAHAAMAVATCWRWGWRLPVAPPSRRAAARPGADRRA